MKRMKDNFQYIAVIAVLLAMFAGGLKHEVVFGELSGNAVGGNLVLNVTSEVYSVYGTVYRSSDNSPLGGAIVTVNTSASAVSLANGTYTLYPVPVGELKLIIGASGYGKQVKIINVVSKDLSGINFYLSELPTFADVPVSHWAWSQVEDVYAAGVTGGCGTAPLVYCPDNFVTRAQMAVFLLKAKHGKAYSPPAPVGVFGDVPVTYWAAAWIEQLAAEGITGGCGNGNYCPDSPVNRDQMAVFLLKAKYGSAYSAPSAIGVFADVPPSYWAADWIEKLASDGITGGCGNGNYCPTNSVTRGQMAVFLDKTFLLP